MSVDPIYAKLVLAVVGAFAAWRSYRSFRRRQRDPSQPRDPVTDRWWRILIGSGSAFLVTMLITLAASRIDAPRWLAIILLSCTAVSVLLVFTASAVLAWRSTP